MSRACPDCKGKGTYQGFNTKPEPCARCRGVGKIDISKEDALASVYDYNAPRRSADITHLFNPCKEIDVGTTYLPRIVTGTAIYVYDAGWHEVFVVEDKNEVYKAVNATETFFISHRDVTYNMTQNRWECIKSGTPTWH